MKFKNFFRLIIIFLFLLSYSTLRFDLLSFAKPTVIFAEEDDDDKEKEDEKEDDDEDDREDKEDDDDDDDRYKTQDDDEQKIEYIIEEVVPNKTTLGPAQTTTTTKPVIRYITIVDPGFDVDSDGDKLVDALDPNPNIPEQDFFTDDDDDGVPNVSDEHPGEDDYLYLTFEDQNRNGVLDSLE